MCGRGVIGKIRRSLILTWLSWNLHTYFQWEDPSPFQQSLWKHPRHPYVAIPTLQMARIDFQSQSPPKIHTDKTCSQDFSTTTEPLLSIPMALQSPHLDLSNDVQYNPILQGDYRGGIGKQKLGKFRFSSPRVGIEAWIPPLESPELTGFHEMTSTSFGTLLKIQNSSSTSIPSEFYM